MLMRRLLVHFRDRLNDIDYSFADRSRVVNELPDNERYRRYRERVMYFGARRRDLRTRSRFRLSVRDSIRDTLNV